MFLQKPGHTKFVIQNRYTCWIPPRPDWSSIEGSELKRSDQFWRRKQIPTFYEERRLEEMHVQEKEMHLVEEGIMKQVRHFDPVLEKYRRSEWTKRIMGHWFMNDGEAQYITGAHYFYLQWCQFDHADNNGYPIFYYNQVPRFYFRQLCWEDPWCLGYVEVGPRGYGKTAEAVSMMIENITKPPNRNHAGIQSKTMEDARQTIFKEKMVPCFNSLPDFFKPQYSHGTDPEKKFVFKRDARSGEKAKAVKFGSHLELENSVTIYSSKEKAMDGPSKKDIIIDEFAKVSPTEEADNYKRTAVNVKVVYRNNSKRGIIREVSTVEEMDEGGNEALMLWEHSDPAKRDGNGYTTSKLYRYFVSALETQTQIADIHGKIKSEDAYMIVMNERKPLEDNPDQLSLVMRKNPITAEEAFIKDQNKSVFDVFCINDAITRLTNMVNKPWRRGWFRWVNDEVDGDVEFYDDPMGNVWIYRMPENEMEGGRKIMNACTYTFDDNGKKLWLPCNDDIYTGGCDPIKYIKTDDPRASKMAAKGFWKFDHRFDSADKPVEEWESHSALWKYWGRSADPEDDYEQVIMGLRYYGHKIMPESNISDFNKHLASRGYNKFRIVRRDFDDNVIKQKKGAAQNESVGSVPETMDSYIRRIKQNIKRHYKRINDLEFLKQARDFDPANPTKFDLVVMEGYTYLSIDRREETQEWKQTKDMIESVFTKYDISGGRSRAVSTEGNDAPDSLTIEEALGINLKNYG